MASLQYGARCPCGYCHIADVESHEQDDHMESFFLAETVKIGSLIIFSIKDDGAGEILEYHGRSQIGSCGLRIAFCA